VVGIGIASGRVVGGLVTQSFGWQWAFYVNLPIGIALIALIVRVIDNSRDPDAMRFDLPGVVCFGGALFLTTLALIEGNHRGWTDPWILSEWVGALVLFALFIVVELNQTRPMLELSYFGKPTYLGANLAQLSFSAGMPGHFIPHIAQHGKSEFHLDPGGPKGFCFGIHRRQSVGGMISPRYFARAASSSRVVKCVDMGEPFRDC
jgi:MFS family permease